MIAVVLDALGFGAGVGYGLLVVALLVVLKQAALEPAWEWLLEWVEQRVLPPHPAEARRSTMAGRGEVVVVSDLHVDTWDRTPEGRAAREAALQAFLDAVEPTTMDLVVNGDLLDAPPQPDDAWQGAGVELRGSLFPKYEEVLADVGEVANRAPVPVTVTLLYGNHDMAASGLRYDLVRRPHLLRRLRLPVTTAWYPNVIIGVPADPARYGQEPYRFYIDHGHFYDPVLLLYLRDFLAAALRQDLRRAFTGLVLVGQRRGAEQQPIPRPGLAPPRPRTLDQRVAAWLVRYRWRWKARRVAGQRSRAEVAEGRRPLTGILFGHTHLPDRYTFRLGGVRGMIYVNTGDWAGDTGHGTYTVITQDGVVTQHDWLDPARRAPHHRGGGP